MIAWSRACGMQGLRMPQDASKLFQRFGLIHLEQTEKFLRCLR
jgi:hypothetical protein